MTAEKKSRKPSGPYKRAQDAMRRFFVDEQGGKKQTPKQEGDAIAAALGNGLGKRLHEVLR